MAVTDTPVFGQTQKNHTVVITTLYDDIADDTPTNTQALVTAGTNGAIVTKITAMPRGTVTATELNLFFTPDGAVFRLMDSLLVAAYTFSTTTLTPKNTFALPTEDKPIRLQAGELIHVGMSVSLTEGMVFYAEWTDL